MNSKRYSISYAPPIAVKDQPHRILDTEAKSEEGIDISSEDYGAISVVGNNLEVETFEVPSEEFGKAA